MDGNSKVRSDTVSVFNGPPPSIMVPGDGRDEIRTVANWLTERSQAGGLQQAMGVVVRSPVQVARAEAAVHEAGLRFKMRDDHVETTEAHVAISTMHLAQGLAFRAVAALAGDDEVIPLQERMEMVGDDAGLQEVYDTERHLLDLACTRARDELLVTAVAPVHACMDRPPCLTGIAIERRREVCGSP